MEGRTLGKIDLRKETSYGAHRATIKDGNDIEENKMAVWEGSKEGVSYLDASL